VLFWPALVAIDRAAEAVGKVARVAKRELEQFRRGLAERLDQTGTSARDPATSAAQQQSVIAVLAAATRKVSGPQRRRGSGGGPRRGDDAAPVNHEAASWLVFEASAGAGGVLHGQQDVGQALVPDRQESLQLGARDQVGPVHLGRGDELPSLGREALAFEDLLQALPRVHCGRSRLAGAGPRPGRRRGMDDCNDRVHADARAFSVVDAISDKRLRWLVRHTQLGHRPLLRPQEFR
jgi:hypothetical protein